MVGYRSALSVLVLRYRQQSPRQAWGPPHLV